MKFTKMHGIGNDYVYVNCFEETVSNPSAVAKFVSDRHFGIGSDGLILIKPSDVADCEMDMYNLDGSQGAMCGNGIRCVAKYAYDYGIVNKTNISVATKSGIKYLDLTLGDDGKVALVKVNMGAPILTSRQIPVVSRFFLFPKTASCMRKAPCSAHISTAPSICLPRKRLWISSGSSGRISLWLSMNVVRAMPIMNTRKSPSV